MNALSSGFISRPELCNRVHSCGNAVEGFCKAVLAEYLHIMSGDLTDVVVIGERTLSEYFHVHMDEVKTVNTHIHIRQLFSCWPGSYRMPSMYGC